MLARRMQRRRGASLRSIFPVHHGALSASRDLKMTYCYGHYCELDYLGFHDDDVRFSTLELSLLTDGRRRSVLSVGGLALVQTVDICDERLGHRDQSLRRSGCCAALSGRARGESKQWSSGTSVRAWHC